MRMMLRITFPTETGNRAIKDGAMPKAIEGVMGKLKPEAAYFTTHNGRRCAMLFFDMKESSEMAVIAEPLFMALNADVELVPVMNAEELTKGLKAGNAAK